jgi:hypothetical protein
MGLKIACSGYLLGYPLGGHSFHHLQYLVGFKRLGHDVTYFENAGWPDSCYDPVTDMMTSDPTYGLTYLRQLLHPHGLDDDWCYLAEDGTSHGMPRAQLAQRLRECDVYFNLSNINWIDELRECRRRALVDTDPVFTQIGGHGIGGPFERYHTLFTYGENVHRPGCTMPTGGKQWLPTRQPVVPELWAVTRGDSSAPITTVMNWTAYGAYEFEGRKYGQKDIEFVPFIMLPIETSRAMAMAVGTTRDVEQQLTDGGWRMVSGREVTRDPRAYQRFIADSKAEFAVAKHAYVSTQCGWFSDRSTGYLASGRPVVVQDTGFSRFLPCDKGLLAFRTRDEALAMLVRLDEDYESHCAAARRVAEEHFHADRVLNDMLSKVV